MFRITKQLKISQSINECNTVEELCQWFRVFVNQIGLKEGKKFAATAFLKSKAQFNSQIIDQLIESGSTQLGKCSQEKTCKSITHSETKCNLDLLPHQVLVHVSFYLPIQSCLNLSMTSHPFHEKIQNNKCLGVNKGCISVQLNPTKINTIVENNCIMECTHIRTSIDINTINDDSYSAFNCTDCPLSRLIDKINSNKNYDLLWFKTIWSNMKHIYISNHYLCALQHIPISWVFEDKHDGSKPIVTFAASLGRINPSIIKRFGKRVKNYISDNLDKKIRKLHTIILSNVRCDIIEIMPLFCGHLTGILLILPRLRDNKCRFQDLDTFFKIFHQNLDQFSIFLNEKDGVNVGIVSQLFKNNEQLCDDLNKTEEQLPFSQFLKKYGAEDKDLPQIKNLKILVGKVMNPYQQSILFQLFNNEKIFKLLNCQESIKSLLFDFHPRKNMIKSESDIASLIEFAASKLNNLEKCSYVLHLKTSLSDETCTTLIEQFFYLANEFLCEMAIKPKLKKDNVPFIVEMEDDTYDRVLDYTIKIESKNELLPVNRNALRAKISSLVDQSIETVKKIWYEKQPVRIEQRFQIKREYLDI